MIWLASGRAGGVLAGAIGSYLLFAAACTSWQEETKGLATAPPATTSSVGGGGAGGAGPCLGCNEFFMATSSCVDPACPGPDEVCEGAARDALEAFMECALCTACPTECAAECGAGGTGGAPGMSDGCQVCVIGTLTGACASEYGTCSQQ
jgi:hypothetical protein